MSKEEEYRRQGQENWNACCDALGWAREGVSYPAKPDRAVAAVIARMVAAEQKLGEIRTCLSRLGVPASEKLFDVGTLMKDKK